MSVRLVSIKNAGQCPEMTTPNIYQIVSSPYCALPEKHEFKMMESIKCRMTVMEPGQLKLVSLIVFALMKNGSLVFCMNQRLQKSLTGRDACQILRIDESLDSLTDVHIFLRIQNN